jgi:peptide/nickel transport system substrate-binding protein
MPLRVLATIALVLAVLAGCARPAPRSHELRLALALDPTSLSPLQAFDQNQIALDQFWCQTLVGLDERNRFIPILIERIPSRANGDVSPGGTRIVYRLRRGVRFADGSPFTSADVAFTFRAILDPANAAVAGTYGRVAALTTPDPYTVVVRLRRPWSAAVHVLFAQADFAYGILPRHAFAGTKVAGSAWERHAFGTGPFRVVAWRRGEAIRLEPNPFFRPRPRLQRIILRIIPDQTAAFNALRTGSVDAAELSPDNVGAAAGVPGLRIARTPENGLRAMYLQTAAAPTNDVRVRRAVAHALDVEELARACGTGSIPRRIRSSPPRCSPGRTRGPCLIRTTSRSRRANSTTPAGGCAGASATKTDARSRSASRWRRAPPTLRGSRSSRRNS